MMKIKRVLAIATLLSLLTMTSYAAEWKQETDGRWKVYDGGQCLVNQWYQDGDNWYLLKEDGYMAEGLYKDVDGSYYYLNPTHDGTYGRLMTTGTYEGVYIETNQNHDGTWGRILNTDVISQLQQAISGGSSSSSSHSGGNSGQSANTGSQSEDNDISWGDPDEKGGNSGGFRPGTIIG